MRGEKYRILMLDVPYGRNVLKKTPNCGNWLNQIKSICTVFQVLQFGLIWFEKLLNQVDWFGLWFDINFDV